MSRHKSLRWRPEKVGYTTYCNYPIGASSEFASSWEDVTCERCLAQRKGIRLEGETHIHREHKRWWLTEE